MAHISKICKKIKYLYIENVERETGHDLYDPPHFHTPPPQKT